MTRPMRKVFISYSSKDRDKAALIADTIEGMDCDCWMAPRDIAPGCSYAEAIVDGLDECMVFMLLLSTDSQASEHVVRELERAVTKGKKIMVVRLERLSLSKSFEYFLQVTHWIDATDSLDAAALAKVADAAVALVGRARVPEPLAARHAGKPSATGEQQLPSGTHGGDAVETALEKNLPSRKPIAVAAIALLAAIGALVYFSPWKRRPVPLPTPTVLLTTTPTPPPTPDSAAYYAGNWRGDVRGTTGFLLKADLTGIRERSAGISEFDEGTWTVDKDGEFRFENSDGGHWLGKFSADGQSLVNTKSGDIFKRIPATPAPVKFDPAKQASYVGTWEAQGKKTYAIQKDGTAIRTERDGKATNGTWEIVDGSFRCKWIGEGTFNGTLSEDGQTMEAQGATGTAWTRQRP